MKTVFYAESDRGITFRDELHFSNKIGTGVVRDVFLMWAQQIENTYGIRLKNEKFEFAN